MIVREMLGHDFSHPYRCCAQYDGANLDVGLSFFGTLSGFINTMNKWEASPVHKSFRFCTFRTRVYTTQQQGDRGKLFQELIDLDEKDTAESSDLVKASVKMRLDELTKHFRVQLDSISEDCVFSPKTDGNDQPQSKTLRDAESKKMLLGNLGHTRGLRESFLDSDSLIVSHRSTQPDTKIDMTGSEYV